MNEAELEVLMWAEAETKAAVHPNPACQPWCSLRHAHTEYAVNGGLLCSRSFGRGVEWAVDVDGGLWAVDESDLAGPLRLLEVDVRIANGARHGLESLHPAELDAFISALQAANEFCRTVTR